MELPPTANKPRVISAHKSPRGYIPGVTSGGSYPYPSKESRWGYSCVNSLTVSMTYFVLSSMVAGGYVFSSGRIGRLVYGG